MPDILRFIEVLTPHVPARIVRHLEKIRLRRYKSRSRLSLVLEFAQDEAGTKHPDENTFVALIETVLSTNKWHWRNQIVAAWALAQANLTHEQRKEATLTLIPMLKYSGKTRIQWHGATAIDIIALTVCWGVVNTLVLTYGIKVWEEVLNQHIEILSASLYFTVGAATLLLVLTPVVPLVRLHCLVVRMKAARQEAARAIGSLGRVEGIPALLRGSQRTGFFWECGRDALKRTLPSLNSEEHYGTLSSDVVPNLCFLLKQSCGFRFTEETSWRMLLLNALEGVGDRRAIDLLTTLTEGEKTTLKSNPVAYERAAQVLEILRERAARETEQETLLRGSVAPVVPETLLRSYRHPIEEAPEQLLRASIEEEE